MAKKIPERHKGKYGNIMTIKRSTMLTGSGKRVGVWKIYKNGNPISYADTKEKAYQSMRRLGSKPRKM